MKAALVDSHRERIRRIEAGEQIVVGLNKYTETEPSPLTADAEGGILVVDPGVEAEQREAVERVARRARPGRGRRRRSAELRARRRDATRTSCPRRSPPPARASTTGEWAQALRDVFGSYRAPTGVGEAAGARGAGDELEALREEVERVSARRSGAG